MDITATIGEIRNEYKEYLRKKHPEWAENTIKTHASDAFYIWNNTLLPSFWKTLISDETMEVGRQAIYDYLKNDLLLDNAEVRAKGYFSDLSLLKEFLDSVYGGVENRVGYEINCEKIVYQYAKRAYDGELTVEQAVDAMTKEVPCFSGTSHKLTVMLFALMVKGEKYTRRSNTETTLYFIRQIEKDYGMEALIENVYVYENNKIKIVFKYRDPFKSALEYVENNQHYSK
ncbi:MAG: hypothetical protein IKW30_00515 [Lachnospiraceae bacterium]|nr:hypothetical protein [Lachnospiraceae bacterium]